MSFLKIGEKDKDGRQKRVEHTGRHLRISRTGGVALRAHVKAGGINVTGNTRHGLRVSTRLAKNTQIAMQNGRFVLRGRYGTDAARFNLSKSGVTVSTKTPIGALNWVKPGRSSVKWGGVQMRGHKAVFFQLIYLVWIATVATLNGIIQFGVGRWQQVRHARERLNIEFAEASSTGQAVLERAGVSLAREPARDLFAGLIFIVTALGRGQTQFNQSDAGMFPASSAYEYALLDDVVVAGRQIVRWLGPRVNEPVAVLGVLNQLAITFATKVETDFCPEALLALDDACLAAGPRTLLQDEMLDLLTESFALHVPIEGE